MIIDIPTQLSQAIEQTIQNYFSLAPKSFPCKITKVIDDGVYVEVETLLKKGENDIPLTIPVMQNGYVKIPFQAGDIGIALNCSFLFETILEDREIENNIEALKNNGLFFVPLVSKEKQKENIEDLVLMNKPKDIKLSLKESEFEVNIKQDKSILKIDDSSLVFTNSGKNTEIDKTSFKTDLSIKQNTLIDIAGAGGNLYKALDILIQLMDLLASGMSGSATNPNAYQAGKVGLVNALKAIIKE